MTKRIALLLALHLSIFALQAQSTAVFTEADLAYKRGIDFYQQGLFGKAQEEFQQTMTLLQPVNEPDAVLLRTKAELHYAKSAVQLKLPDGEKLILDFIRKYKPDPMAMQALNEIAKYYYDSKEYEKAITFYDQVDWYGLSKTQRDEARFRLGYSYFVTKQFAKAKTQFREIKDVRNEYYEPTNYYLGLCYFFEGNYRDAITSLKVAEKNARFRDQIPYYIAQIYFAERQYDELIAYAKPLTSNTTSSRAKEIQQLLGQAYFEKGDYQSALPYLEFYAERTGKLREEEFYQLGYAQYMTGNYPKAARSFEELSRVDSKVGQYAMYYLGDSYVRLNQKSSARTAFAAAKRMNYDPAVREDALFNYAKLSYELKDPREAITALQSIRPESQYYGEAQNLMSEIFLSYRDYKQAMDVIEQMTNKTPAIRETYQKVTYLRGLQLLQSNDLPGARQHFDLSLKDAPNAQYRALATYWLGDLAYRDKDYNTSIRQFNQFLTLAKTMSNLPDESSLFTANYLQGYNYLKQENYNASLGFFKESMDGIKRNRSFIKSEVVRNQILGDATMRAADCLFKRNQYADAIKLYDEAINARYAGFEYAIYQKAIIEGLRGRPTDKILALDRLVKDFPNSEFADDALLAMGSTYQEMGQLNQAVAPLRQLVTNYRGKSDLINQGLLRLGLISYNQANLEGAISYYKQVFSNNPDPNEAALALSALEEIYINDMGKPDAYFAFLETIPGYKVDNMAKDSISFRAALTQFENGNYPRAIESYTDYLRKYPSGIHVLDAYFQRGESYAVLKQYSEALKDYEFVVGRGPSRHYLKALEKASIIAYNHEQNFNKSYDLYTKLETAATSPDLRFEAQLGALRSAYRAGNTQAVNTYANKVSSNPAASPAQVATANFYLGKQAFDRKDYNGALTSLQEVVRLSDNEQTAEARYLIANIHYLRRDLNRAQELCIAANRESSAYPYWVAQTVILLSDVFLEKGELQNARAVLEAVLENYTEDPEVVKTARDKLAAVNARINAGSRLDLNRNINRLDMDNSGN
ncbi:MAG: tetratricopeptide repeat protein [Saprospiraceae bacterium]|nr:tetratricopeptide repeat protein [Saprospiraceae bacterium]